MAARTLRRGALVARETAMGIQYRRPDCNFDCAAGRAWAGNIARLNSLRVAGGFHPAAEIFEFADQIGDARLVKIHGLVTRPVWEWIAQELAETPAGTRLVMLWIDSVVHEAFGWELASAALRGLDARTATHAHVDAAGGLMLHLAQACDSVSARGAAPIGWLRWEAPVQAWLDEGPQDVMGGAALCALGERRGLTVEATQRLAHWATTGEALEQRGVAFLAKNWTEAMRVVMKYLELRDGHA